MSQMGQKPSSSDRRLPVNFRFAPSAYADSKDVPIGRAVRPEEIASVVLWLCSPGASYVVGHALTVDGGMTVP
jgi:NAD(P)-dependent dehydrogenase (short-subunit alcohol dehydrogenase family)